MTNKLHIVCFDVPFPPTYGGIIDIYYKIRALHENGMQIHLHVFKYGRSEDEKLNKYCASINYYDRKTSVDRVFSFLPYTVLSREDKQLVKNLKAVNAPILYEGLHSTLTLKRKLIENRKTLVRPHNIEHQYYNHLSKIEPVIYKKIYYKLEAVKLKFYEKLLNQSEHILAISQKETDYFNKNYGDKATYIPAFHPNTQINKLSKKGYFALYHGNLSVSDNRKSAHYIIDTFKSIDYPLVIAGQTDDKKLLSKIDGYKNISFITLKDNHHLSELFQRAHINILFSYQNSGIKLKLVNALFQSRYTIANSNIALGSGLESLCEIADSKTEIRAKVNDIINLDFSEKEIEKRKKLLAPFNNHLNAQKIIDLLNL